MYDSKRVFAEYLNRTTEKQIFIESLCNRFLKHHKSPTSILDLGCHDGLLSLKYLSALGPTILKKSRFVGIDPSATAIEAFQCRELPSHVSFEFQVGTAEEYCASCKEVFNWVIASHCLYWSVDLYTTLKHLIRCGENIGIVIRQDIGIYQVQATFQNLLGNSKEQLFTAHDIESALKKFKIPFIREDIKSSIQIPTPDSEDFAVLMAFFLQTEPATFSKDSLRELKKYMSQFNKVMPHHVSFFWVRLKS